MKDELLKLTQTICAPSPLLSEVKAKLGMSETLDFGADQIDSKKLGLSLCPGEEASGPMTANWDDVFQALSGPVVLRGLEDSDRIFHVYDTHMELAIQAFRLLKPESKVTSWTQLNNEDFLKIPPVVIYLQVQQLEPQILAPLAEIMTGEREFKVIVSQANLHQNQPREGRALPLQNHLDLGFFGLFFRQWLVLQTPVGGKGFSILFQKAMESPRPALISLYDPSEANLNQFALETRAFPSLLYDPEIALDWEGSLDISQNPSPTKSLVRSAKGEALTLAHFLFKQNPDLFEPLVGNAVPLDTWLEGDRSLAPYLDIEGEGTKWAIPPSLQEQIISQVQLWGDLQKMAGITETTKPQQGVEGLDEIIKRTNEKAVAEAMERLSAKLLGISGIAIGDGEITLETEAETDSGAASRHTQEPEEEPTTAEAKTTGKGLANEEAWIESPLCTACDECTGINPKIFAYNGEKQATLINPAGGPFADLVKAAEKCPASIIHPGVPLNGKEKNLDKWLKRAAKLA